MGPGFRRGRRRGVMMGAAMGAGMARRRGGGDSNDQAAAAPSGGDDSTAELEKLAELKDKGVITQDEFDAKKKQILGL